MRGRKLLDQSLRQTKDDAGTLVFLLELYERILLLCPSEVKNSGGQRGDAVGRTWSLSPYKIPSEYA